MYQINILYTLNLYNAIYQIYANFKRVLLKKKKRACTLSSEIYRHPVFKYSFKGASGFLKPYTPGQGPLVEENGSVNCKEAHRFSKTVSCALKML